MIHPASGNEESQGEELYDESDVVALAERAVDDINSRIIMLGEEYKSGSIDRIEAELRLFGLAYQYANAYRTLAEVLQCEDIAVAHDGLDELIEELWDTHFSESANQLGYQSLEMHDSFMEELDLAVERAIAEEDM